MIDRIPSRWDSHWEDQEQDWREDVMMVRPVTPASLEEVVWDPYRVRDLEVCY